jgi:FKBP-type peptidyl-prolyl cis-trans isomerase SlyD
VNDLVIEPNNHVTVDYELRDEDGVLLDGSGGEGSGPIEYVHGYGMLVPGLEAALAGLRAGDEREVIVPSDSGYGDRDEGLVLEVDRSQFPDPNAVVQGDEFVAESPEGDEVVMRVVGVSEDVVVVDANHPLAGITLLYRVKVRNVRRATQEEIESAATDFDEAREHVHGPDCDHGHDVTPVGRGPREVN